MLSLDKNKHAFFALVQAGLWQKLVSLASYGDVNYDEIYRLAQEQSVVGLVAAGLERGQQVQGFDRSSVPQSMSLTLAGEVLQLEQRNRAMNGFVAELIEKLRKEDVYALLVKGQGIAQCYERPLWRSSGDVDLLLSEDNYKKAIQLLTSQASSIEDESTYKKHIAMTIDGWSVELHGTLRSGLWGSIDKEIDDTQNALFLGGSVRSWRNGGTQIFLPAADEDVFFVFTHILQHFYKEGIGLRQICDWCRLMWTYKESLNQGLLESRIRKAGVMTEWKAFAALAVEYLGMPADAMPLYGANNKWSKKAQKVMAFIMETGNFGNNRDYSYRQKYPFVVFKAISLWRHLQDFGRYFVIFPLDAIKVTWRRICVGMAVAIKGKRHE